MGKCMGRTCIIMCHGAHVITNIQTPLICCLTCLFRGVVMHGCVALTGCRHGCVMPTKCGHGCVMPTRCGHGCVMPTRCGHGCVTLTRCGRPTRCITLTRLTASMPLTSTCLSTTHYNRFTCVAHIACIVQG